MEKRKRDSEPGSIFLIVGGLIYILNSNYY